MFSYLLIDVFKKQLILNMKFLSHMGH